MDNQCHVNASCDLTRGELGVASTWFFGIISSMSEQTCYMHTWQ